MKIESNINNKDGCFNLVAQPIVDLAYKHFMSYIKELEELNPDLSLNELNDISQFVLNHEFNKLSIRLINKL